MAHNSVGFGRHREQLCAQAMDTDIDHLINCVPVWDYNDSHDLNSSGQCLHKKYRKISLADMYNKQSNAPEE